MHATTKSNFCTAVAAPGGSAYRVHADDRLPICNVVVLLRNVVRERQEVGTFAGDHIYKSLLTCLGITLSLSRWYDNLLRSR